MSKSALKKCIVEEVHDDRRVTFCKTVVIFGYPSNSDVYDESQDPENTPELCDTTVLLSPEVSEVCDGQVSPDEPEDFLVHKVVYRNLESPDDSLQDFCSDVVESDDIVYYPNESETELQEFVVHCVSKLEKEKLASEECASGESSNASESKDHFPELSVENIEQHNKLTKSEIIVDTEECNIGASLNSDIVLSPPLQELGIERLICKQSDKWFWNLNISPLNSVQETDSGSNISSEDTMIMMTTEECEKNEQHIQQSLQKFETLKKLKSLKENVEGEVPTIEVLNKDNCETSAEQLMNVESQPVVYKDSESFFSETDIKGLTPLLSSDQTKDPLPIPDIDQSNHFYKKAEVGSALFSSEMHPESKEGQSTDSVSSDCSKCGYQQSNDASCNNNVVSLNDSLISIQIPDDVREWKIKLNEVKENLLGSEMSGAVSLPEEVTYPSLDSLNLNSKSDYLEDSSSISLPSYKTDELESFVHQCTDRIERIKKRYSISEKTLWTSRRGIRQRFGSTAQILQQMQGDGHYPVPSHYSWPCYTSVGTEVGSHYLPQSRPDLLTSTLDNLPPVACHNPVVAAEPNTSSARSNSTESTVGKSFVSNCLETSIDQTPSPSLLCMFHERGVPEGSSPPRVSTESLNALTSETQSISALTDSVIYYSMKV